MEWLNYIAAAGTLLLGLVGLFNPGGAKAIVGLTAETTSGKSEFRASFGGLWIALGAVPLLTMAPLAFGFLGIVWLGTAAGRLVSFVLDKTVDRQNIFNVSFEIVFGLLCLVGAPWGALLAAI